MLQDLKCCFFTQKSITSNLHSFRLVTNLALIQGPAFVVRREGHDTIQVVTNQAIRPPRQGVGDTGPAFFFRFGSRFGLLVTERAGFRFPDDVVLGIGINPVQVVTGDTFGFLALHQMGNRGGGDRFQVHRFTCLRHGRFVTLSAQGPVVIGVIIREGPDCAQSMTDLTFGGGAHRVRDRPR